MTVLTDLPARPLAAAPRPGLPAAAVPEALAADRRRAEAQDWARQLAPQVIDHLVERALGPRAMIGEREVALASLRPQPVPVQPLDGAAFASGAGRREDFLALAAREYPIGITVGAAGPEVLALATDYVARGGRIFVDSGAFREAVEPDLANPTDFEAVFRVYRSLVAGACAAGSDTPSRITLVLPDRPCHQIESLRRMRAYADDVRELLAAGVDALVPLQAPNRQQPTWGNLTPGAYWSAVEEILTRPEDTHRLPIRAAFPCARGRWPLPDVLDFLRTYEPAGVHLLGMGDRSRLLDAWMPSIRRVLPHAVCTRDACPFTAVLGDGRGMTEFNRAATAALSAAIERRWPLEDLVASIYTEPRFLQSEQARSLARALEADRHLSWAQGAEQLFAEAAGQATTAAWERQMDRRGWRSAMRILEERDPDLWDTSRNSRVSFLIDLCLAGDVREPRQILTCVHQEWARSLAVPLGRGLAAAAIIDGPAHDVVDGPLQLDVFGGATRV